MNQMMNGLQMMDQQSKTKRQEALQLQSLANDYRQQGYDVTPDMLANNLKEEPNGLAKLFGAESPQKTDIFANRTKEWTDKQTRDAEDRKFKRQSDMLGLQKTQAEIDKMNREGGISPQQKFNNELAQEQQKELGKKNTNLFAVKNAMDSALVQLNNPNLSEEEKIKAGQGLLKLLNSAEGSDAVGAEEAKRIGSYLEHKMFNVFEPGSMFGRDLDLFTDQVQNNSSFLADRIKRNEEGMRGIGQGQSLSQMANAGKSSQPSTVALSPDVFRGQKAAVNFAPIQVPNVNPIQNAVANQANAKRVSPQQVQQVKAMSDDELMKFINGN